ncbi:hypothetical protein TRFO_15289 [Tritrichomonas foetus]|uniref:DnaK protein n=1 Tax=Tritrichomonas foetus TaxID=1144522 RepID=A0A1J4KTY0_9EUKA|nr:hypothetical protein TRFO_15289 [Tritrichomonas foetus]|eukprot:OHT14368.1 hypothetical protein TRFO_15289 [Tritrichomonas foetus]
MLFLFSIFCASEVFLGIDFGAKYLKLATTDLDGSNYKITKLGTHDIHPGCISIKTPRNSVDPLTPQTSGQASIVTGHKALPMVHRIPKSGSEFLLNSVVRDTPEYRTATVLNQTTLLNLYFFDIIKQIPDPAPKGLAITFPTFFTPEMRRKILEPLSHLHIPVKHHFDTLTAISILYANNYLEKYKKQNRTVLFIDFGASYVETHLVNFSWDGHATYADCSVTLWSDKCSGNAFARALAKSIRLPLSQADRMLKNSEDAYFAPDAIQDLRNLLNETLEIGGEIDEVQLLGGGSTYRFVQTVVRQTVTGKFRSNSTKDANSEKTGNNEGYNEKKVFTVDTGGADPNDSPMATGGQVVNATNSTAALPIYKDFDPLYSIVKGTLEAVLMIEGRLKKPHTYIGKRPVASYYVRVGEQREKYCQRHFTCKPTHFTGHGAEFIQIETDPRHLPVGSPTIVNQYRLLNISTLFPAAEGGEGQTEGQENDQGNGIVQLDAPDPIVARVNWCNATVCAPIAFHQYYESNEDYSIYYLMSGRIGEQKIREDIIVKVGRALDRMRALIYPGGSSSMRIDYKVREKYDKYAQEFGDGTFMAGTLNEIEKKVKDIKSLCISLGFRYD